jgi:hypothetical protein
MGVIVKKALIFLSALTGEENKIWYYKLVYWVNKILFKLLLKQAISC